MVRGLKGDWVGVDQTGGGWMDSVLSALGARGLSLIDQRCEG